MAGTSLLDAVKNGDLPRVRDLIQSGEDVNQQDEQGWTPLNWAAAQGDLEAVKTLLNNGADLLKVGRDERTPYMIALAAGRVEVVKYLRQEEVKLRLEQSPNRRERPYCKAYYLRLLRQFSGWKENRINWKEKREEDKTDEDRRKETGGIIDADIVYVHQDLTVTHSMWHNEDVIFDEVTPQWQTFCEKELKFKVPDDLDLIVPDSVREGAVAAQKKEEGARDAEE